MEKRENSYHLVVLMCPCRALHDPAGSELFITIQGHSNLWNVALQASDLHLHTGETKLACPLLSKRTQPMGKDKTQRVLQ